MVRALVTGYLPLLISSAAAGAASGFFYPATMGVRGAILGGSLSLGLMFLNVVEQKNLLLNAPPRISIVLASAALAGLLAGLLLNLYGMGAGNGTGDFPPQATAAGLPTFAVSMAYSLLLIGAYNLRWIINGGRDICLLIISLAGCLGTLSRAFIDPALTASANQIIAILFLSLFSGLPFAFLWGVAVISFDPGWFVGLKEDGQTRSTY
jgi:hypothetical protein